RSRVAFLIKARPDSITPEVADRLDKLGVVGVFLGVENASATGLSSLIRGSKVDHISRAFSLLDRHGIVVTYNLLIFHPHATLDEINENILFMKEHPGYPFDFGRAEIVAGSPLERQVMNEGLLMGSWPNWDYRICDPDVDRLFRISLATFRRPDSGYSGLAHTMIALAYGAHVVHRLYPGPAADSILADTHALIARSNTGVLDQIFRMYALAAEPDPAEGIESLAGSIRTSCTGLISDAEALTRRMNRLQVAERKFRDYRVSGALQQSGLLRTIFQV
ncbi:MAG: radical SAM protein, partial [Methanomicrobiales archaeon]|nr:radical SAM protein [Methanomicrobiales archaeon]